MELPKDLKPGDTVQLEETYWNFGKPEVETIEAVVTEDGLVDRETRKPVKYGINSTYKLTKETRDE